VLSAEWRSSLATGDRQVVYAGKTESDNTALQFGAWFASIRSIRRGRRGHFPAS